MCIGYFQLQATDTGSAIQELNRIWQEKFELRQAAQDQRINDLYRHVQEQSELLAHQNERLAHQEERLLAQTEEIRLLRDQNRHHGNKTYKNEPTLHPETRKGMQPQARRCHHSE